MASYSGGTAGPAGGTLAKTGGATPHWNQVTVQADYFLSRTTELYATAAYLRVGGGNGIQAFNAGIYNMTQSSGDEQVVAGIGIRHRF
jgi:GBP family porin